MSVVDMEFMNQTEFASLVHIAKKHNKNESIKNMQFELSPKSGLASSKALFLSAKQQIPIFTQPSPPHPGTMPETHGSALVQWKERANAYAHYFLMMYWPEPLSMHDLPMEYTWDAFQNWIEKQRQSNTAFGICRLMLMHCRMQRMYTDNQMQLIFTDYWTAPHDLWTSEKRSLINSRLQMEYQPKTDEIEDEEWNLSNSILGSTATTQLHNVLKFSDMQLKSLQCSMPVISNVNMASNSSSHSHHHAPCTNPSDLSPPLQAKQVQLCF